MDAWGYYKKSVGSIRGQLNTNAEAIATHLTQRGYGPQDELWISQMGALASQMTMEEDLLQRSQVVSNLRALSASVQDRVGKGMEQVNSRLTTQLGRQARPWELKLEGLKRYTP